MAAAIAGLRTTFRFKKPDTLTKQARMGRPVGVSPFMVVTGLEAVTASFVNASFRAQDRAVAATDQASFAIRDAQWDSAPVLSGETRDSITNIRQARYNGYARSVGPTWFVSRFLVFGTVKMSPKWDLFGASRPHVESWQKAMEDAAKVLP
jgi:hypothetical protein